MGHSTSNSRSIGKLGQWSRRCLFRETVVDERIQRALGCAQQVRGKRVGNRLRQRHRYLNDRLAWLQTRVDLFSRHVKQLQKAQLSNSLGLLLAPDPESAWGYWQLFCLSGAASDYSTKVSRCSTQRINLADSFNYNSVLLILLAPV